MEEPKTRSPTPRPGLQQTGLHHVTRSRDSLVPTPQVLCADLAAEPQAWVAHDDEIVTLLPMWSSVVPTPNDHIRTSCVGHRPSSFHYFPKSCLPFPIQKEKS